MKIDVIITDLILPDSSEGKGLKIQSEFWELNVQLNIEEFKKLKEITSYSWESGSFRAGVSANSPVFWSCDENLISILVGEDDELWDFGVFIPQRDFLKSLENEI